MRGWIMLMAAVLAGCTQAPATRHYLLAPVDAGQMPQPVSAGAPLTLVVRDVRVPLYLDRPEIVTRTAGQGLTIHEYAHWSGNLREEMARVLTDNLTRRLAGHRVLAVPFSATVVPDYRVELEIEHFERHADGRVRLGARWWLSGADNRVLDTPAATLEATPTDESFGAMTTAMNHLCGQLADAMAHDLLGRRRVP